MNEFTDEKILKLAEEINDGTAAFDNKQSLTADDTVENQKLVSALAQINQITHNIRNQNVSESRNLKQGDTWAHLTIIKKIGEGGIGEVYCAFDPVLDSNVAVKFLNQRSQLYISKQQFLDEARNMAKVHHPHVLAIHGATVDQGIPGYWSDYLDGLLLSELLRQQPMQWDSQLTYALHLCQAVKAIHDNQLVHGDIKASNVMIQPQRGAILLDFGSSRHSSQETKDKYVQQASPMAMAPEQFNGHAANHSTDIFALGLVFWQLTTNQHPLQNLALEDIKRQVKHFDKHISSLTGARAWRNLIVQMVAAQPDQRPNISQVEKALQHLVERPARKAKQLATVAVLLLAAGITSISLYSSHKTAQAQQETQAMNTLLSDILLTSSPLKKGKDTLLKDVLIDAQEALLSNQIISQRQKTKSLLQLLQTFRTHSNNEQALELSSVLLSEFDLTNSEKLDLLMQKADMLNRNRKFKQSEPLYQQALSIEPNNKEDADVLVLTHIGLIKNYIETSQLNKVPAELKKAKQMWQTSNQKKSNLGLIHQIEGNYFEAMKQYQNSFESYQKAKQNFESFYGSQNLNVLIVKGNAATVLSFTEETREQSAEMMESLVTEMTNFLGVEHTSTLIARVNLSSIYGQLDQPKKALETIIPYMEYVYQAFGKEGGTTLAFENIIAELYVAAKDLKQADERFLAIISTLKKTQGKTAVPTLEAQLKRVDFLQESNQLELANQVLNDLQEITNNHHSTNDRITLDVTEYVIWNQHLQGSENALKLMQKLKEKKSSILGKEDPSTLSTIKKLDSM